MKKKIVAFMMLVVVVISMIGFTSCNKVFMDTTYHFKKVHVFETGKCYEIVNWTDFEDGDQIQVKIKDYGVCLFHSNQIVLIEDQCPFCKAGK